LFQFDEIRQFIMTLPATKEMDHFGKPSYRINNKIFATLQPDGYTLTVKTVGEDRTIFTTMAPDTYSVPDTFANLNYMHINLNTVSPKELKGLIIKAWSSVAPKRIVRAFEDGERPSN